MQRAMLLRHPALVIALAGPQRILAPLAASEAPRLARVEVTASRDSSRAIGRRHWLRKVSVPQGFLAFALCLLVGDVIGKYRRTLLPSTQVGSGHQAKN
jgi:hypothetical protein